MLKLIRNSVALFSIATILSSNVLAQVSDSVYVDDYDPYEDDDIEISEETEEVFELYQVQTKAQFIGGDSAMMGFISNNLIVPDNIISGTIVVQFIVQKDSSINDVIIYRTKKEIPFEQQQAAIDVVKKMSGMWTPAYQRDRPVAMRFVLPIRFEE
jgi:periplasmic protein TonB